MAILVARGVGAASPGVPWAVAGLSAGAGDAASSAARVLRLGDGLATALELIVGTVDIAARLAATA